MTEYNLQILYSQFSVHTSESPEFPHWTNEHVSQGVAWRPGHVSFGIPDHDGTCLLDVGMTDQPLIASSTTERLLAVPFDVGPQGGAAVATILETIDLNIQAGAYQLWFELLREPQLVANGQAYRIVVRFQKCPDANFIIIRQGREMSSESITIRYAEPEL